MLLTQLNHFILKKIIIHHLYKNLLRLSMNLLQIERLNNSLVTILQPNKDYFQDTEKLKYKRSMKDIIICRRSYKIRI